MSFLRISGILPLIPNPKTIIIITLFEGMLSFIFAVSFCQPDVLLFHYLIHVHKDKYTRAHL